MITSILETLILVIAMSIDSFVASFAYGSDKIKIPFISIAIISSICSLVLTASLFLGKIISPILPSHLTNIICFTILFLLGIIKLFDSSIKTFIRKHNNINKKINFSIFNLRFILNIYADPQKADTDLSRELSPLEAMALAFALSVDGLVVGMGAGILTINFLEVIIFSFIFGVTAVLLGSYVGYKIAQKIDLNLSWLSGILLIVLAIIKL